MEDSRYAVYNTDDKIAENQKAPIQQKNNFAIASLILGLFGLIPLFGLWATVLAIGFGRRALWKIKENPETTGRGMAITGIVLGIVEFLTLFGLVGAALINYMSKG